MRYTLNVKVTFLHDRTGRLEIKSCVFGWRRGLHDRTGRLEILSHLSRLPSYLHDRTGRLEK